MTCREILPGLKSWFLDYAARFESGPPGFTRNIDLKKEHTMRVCAEILDVGGSLGLDGEDLCLAETAALFHDVGRFEQYARYGTFRDALSEDHAALGVKVLVENDVLEPFGGETRGLILGAVSNHNRAEIPRNETERGLFFSRLLRDADKLDIWRVVTTYYAQKAEGRNETIELDLPDRPVISERVYEDLMAGRIVRMADLATFDDFKALQMGWIFDVNFPRTFLLVRERGYLEAIRDALASSERALKIYSRARSHLEERCHGL